MGVDLRLIPIMYQHNGSVYPHCQLELDRHRDLWEAMARDLNERPLGQPMWSHEDDGIIERSDNPYGSPLTYVTARDMASFLSAWQPGPDGHELGPWTRAAAAYLAELPPGTKVVMWWH